MFYVGVDGIMKCLVDGANMKFSISNVRLRWYKARIKGERKEAEYDE